MITRRSFLAALSCLPFVGKLIPQTYELKTPDCSSHPVIWSGEISIGCDKEPHCLCPWHQGLRDMADRIDQEALKVVYSDVRLSRDGGQTWERRVI